VNTCGLPLVPDGALLVANGKQALSLVAQDLRDRGVRTLLAPDFYCLTMIQPFQLEGITVRHVATDARALLDSQALADELATGHRVAVLHCEVFGGLAGARLRDVLEAAQAEGVPVVVDVTHSLFAISHGPADYLVASLRKLLPVPDGAFVTGLPGRPGVARHELDAMATRWGLIAARRRRDLLTGRGSATDYLDAVDVAEEAMLGARAPASMSRAALQRLSRLDPDALRLARQGNATYLIECLTSSGVEALNPSTPECGVVVRVEDAPSVERDLLAAGILCPISWPRPPGLRHHIPWPTRWVALPVDPDLAPQILDRAASIVEHAASPRRSW
jgi:selenocysteine lyase/cysteine desulfurase